MEQWFYYVSGLSVVSAMPLPEWAAFAIADAPACPDLVISVRRAGEEAPQSERQGSSITPDEYRFFIPEAAHYCVRRSGSIEIWPEPGADRQLVRAFLLGSAFGAFHHLRGLMVLHCSVVQVGDTAVAFCGESGAGKSTLAAWMSVKGYPLVSDDLCRVELSGDGLHDVYRSATRMKLWRETLAMLGWEDDSLERDHFRMDKFHVPLANGGARDRLPLAAIYLPVWGDLAMTRLSGLSALRRFIGAATYRGELLEPMERLEGYWRRSAELLQHVPVWEFSRPKSAARAEEGISFLLSHMVTNMCAALDKT